MAKSIDEAYNWLEEMVANNYQWPVERSIHRRVADIHDIDVFFHIIRSSSCSN